MSVTVVDASAVAAVLFDEPESEPLLAAVRGDLVAPTLLLYELASVCTTKLIRRPSQTGETLARYALFDELSIEFEEPDWGKLPSLAVAWSLSAYDAAYLQLALKRADTLLTLDARLAAAYDSASARQRRN
jgi:predicted nucleic acid-binding protein